MHKPTCPYCDAPTSQYIGHDGEALCADCARREILGVLNDMDPEDVKKLRRRIEDRLRKSPKTLREVAVSLMIEGEI